MKGIDINVELFKRYAPKKKLEIVEKLSFDELMNVSMTTLERIVKEVGKGAWSEKRSRNKRLSISSDLQKGNNWNSDIEEISLYKGKLYLGVYLQYENTDTIDETTADSFFSRGDTRIDICRDDRYGNPRTYYAVYEEEDKAEVMRSILLQYIYSKYKEQLKENKDV